MVVVWWYQECGGGSGVPLPGVPLTWLRARRLVSDLSIQANKTVLFSDARWVYATTLALETACEFSLTSQGYPSLR